MKDEFLATSIARAAHAAQRDPRLVAGPRIGVDRRKPISSKGSRPSSATPARNAAHRRPARHEPDRFRQSAPRRAGDRPVRVVQAASTPSALGRSQGNPTAADHRPARGPVSGDPSRLQQVVWNLLSNAIKFTPKGGKVDVMLERVNSHFEITRERLRHRHRAGVPAARLRAFSPGRCLDDARARRTRPRSVDREAARRAARRHGPSEEPRREQGSDVHRRLPLVPVRSAAGREHPTTASTVASSPRPSISPASKSWSSMTRPTRASSSNGC